MVEEIDSQGPSVQSKRGGLRGSIGFLFNHTINPIQPGMTKVATTATVTSPLVRRLANFQLSSKSPIHYKISESAFPNSVKS